MNSIERKFIAIGMEPVNRRREWDFEDEAPVIRAREVVMDAAIMIMVAACAAVAALLIWG